MIQIKRTKQVGRKAKILMCHLHPPKKIKLRRKKRRRKID